MTKPFANIRPPRWRNLLLARALLFALAFVLSSSGEDFEPLDAEQTCDNLSTPQRSGQSGGHTIEPSPKRGNRELHTKSAGSKSGSSKGGKSKSAKSKSGKSKSARSKSAGSKSAKSADGSKSAKSASDGSKSGKSAESKFFKSKSAESKAGKSKSGKGESALSMRSHGSEEYLDLDTESENDPLSVQEVYSDGQDSTVDAGAQSVSSTSGSSDSSSTVEMEDTESTRIEASETSSDGGVQPDDRAEVSGENDEIIEPTNQAGVMGECNNDETDCKVIPDAPSSSGNVVGTNDNIPE